MVNQPAIQFQNVSKRFSLVGQSDMTFLETAVSLFSRSKRPALARDLWAVQDVNFAVQAGECVGIIGRNGSGKSTALKLITRILRPTSGRIEVHGRISALLELGAGFHPDLTGRENIFLNASILGLSKQETARHYDSIVEFSELNDFIHIPVKHYSSGMYMRLGFSVAIHLSPDILIIDEILSVGDQAFQTKCIDRIYEMKDAGTTIVIVSHHLERMRRLCSRMVWLDSGRLQQNGPTEEVAEQYLVHSAQYYQGQFQNPNGAVDRMGSGEIELTAVRFLDVNGKEQTTFTTGSPMTVEMNFMAHKPVANPAFGLAMFHQDGTRINGPNTQFSEIEMGTVMGSGVVRYRIEALPLLPAKYVMTTAVQDGRLAHYYDFHRRAYSFYVVSNGAKEMEGVVEFPASWAWELENLSPSKLDERPLN